MGGLPEVTTFKYDPVEIGSYTLLNSLISYEDDFESITMQLLEAGIEVEQIHKESSKGQFEMAIRYTEVMRSIDNYNIAKMTIQKHFEKKGIIVSFIPKPSADEMGNGAHSHLSLWKL